MCLTHLGLRLFYNYCEFEDCMKGAVVGHFCYKHRGGQYNPKIALRAANATHRETVDHGRRRIRKLKYCNFEGCKKLANQKGGWCRKGCGEDLAIDSANIVGLTLYWKVIM